ncbi:hypothetical protein EAF04_005157 [Stromatinia cepivora]|nr:hypothetical protein EAF04_005157 [Stromatinia cepivora]
MDNGWIQDIVYGTIPLSTSEETLGNIRAVPDRLELLRNVPPDGILSNTAWQGEGYTVTKNNIEVQYEQAVATNGYYISTMIPKTSVFIAENNLSPTFVIAEDKIHGSCQFLPNQIPHALSAWSDVTFLQWKKACTSGTPRPMFNVKQLKGINKFSRFHIINEVTMGIIERVRTIESRSPKTDIPEPHTFPMSTPEGQALLGSPNGKGVGFFLSQHKGSLGIKTIESVTVFATDANDDYYYQAYFSIVDVP